VTAGSYDILAEAVSPTTTSPRTDQQQHPLDRGVRRTETFLYLKLANRPSTGCSMTTTTHMNYDIDALSAKARDHLWMQLHPPVVYANSPVPTIVRGDGASSTTHGKRYLDGLPACSSSRPATDAQTRRGGLKQPRTARLPLWSSPTRRPIELADRLAD